MTMTKKEAVRETLDEQVRLQQQKEIVKLFGTIYFDPEYDACRNRKLDMVEEQH
jgi:hypothetical protein